MTTKRTRDGLPQEFGEGETLGFGGHPITAAVGAEIVVIMAIIIIAALMVNGFGLLLM